MKKLIVANWKMYLGLRESVALARQIRSKLSFVQRKKLSFEIVVCPSFVALEKVAKVLKRTEIKLGAQDVEPARSGAFTGEVGLDDLQELGVQYVLVGHSERRQHSGDTDAIVNQKLRAILKAGMRPILCVGESWNVRRAGNAQKHVSTQLCAGLRGVHKKDFKRVVVAYEPVWAIGTDRADTPEDASEMHRWIRKVIHGGKASGAPEALPHVLYGGSVNAKNYQAFLCTPGIDGLLIGLASTQGLFWQSFSRG